ncbi:hypothetical protein H206_00989 [Candidatus Electrothrix aarhusensis]|uniref:Uncharacterized protein n=1 Tax=Candidatus Electrothrix aarhusensis TaxID=1859131 RepID=A0A3S3R6A8_9BACT|nr:hypothetical protein H206_00989 [Candidatus Electrothrix aarhusensis]
MKFQCGRCGKNYLVDNADTDTVDKTLTIPCSACGNSFCIDENMAFSSASGNSKIICENCGQLVIEKVKACPSCNLVLNKQDEEKRIDNKEYEKILVQDGKVVQPNGKKGGKKIILAALLVLILAGIGGAFWFFSTQQHTLQGTLLEPVAEKMPNLSGRDETQVVIMMNGQTYYAKKIEKDGSIVRITTKSGAVVEVAKKDVLDITTAVIEE